MRVISGDRKGTALKAVPGDSTRPTSDKVKESIFNMIGPYFSGGSALDLYGGAGGLGIEALSRGAESAVFVDRDFKAVRTIRENLKASRLQDRSEVFKNDAGRALQALVKRERSFDLIFLDPPYAKQQLGKEILYISDNHLLSPGGRVIAEHDSRVTLEHQYEKLILSRQERYGDTTVSIYEWMETEENE
ncbi:16S rRNA (guanine(966)-N(2))-methyltransferase RsmD [Alteribacter lacisalsi]|jgi:16S rRNA (guanine966-N2)-methyltransferase|uniref:16S rRNA (Guanine(966)-N(2))-methyltransferase RsmD n=1 Tax=Alteribacter lacisalsi TaxID=2045244 RepID=A0A2W0H7T1_9BACI|nr:16S rRNA (guanine(966)-N(2))-methyltransferase RsmD [Alteribacter lacisalsi]PYZ97904.1 16S rRNA (guanine(966)-N(2))-methyltransferase RsmD [Alteribacter lacisalsi]